MTQQALTVRQVMDPLPVFISPNCPVQAALALMNEHRIGSVLVVSEGNRLEGIFTERDLLRRVALATPGWREIPVSEWMTTNPHSVLPDVGWDDAVGLMQQHRVRHLPVVEQGRVIGIVSARMLMARRTDYLNRVVMERTAELRAVNEQLLARDAEMIHNLKAAGRLQNRVLLPHSPSDWPDLQWAIHYSPLDHLGGDYYDFALPDVDHLGFLIADASGHSIPAALVAIMTRWGFAQASNSTHQPGLVLTEMNSWLQDLIEERFVTAHYGVFDRRTGVFRYATAGHPSPLHFQSHTGQVRELFSRGFMLGIMPDEVYAEQEVALEPGDKIIFYTDGLTDARNEIGELYGAARLSKCVISHGRGSADELLSSIMNCLRMFTGDTPLTDDITVVVAEVVPESTPLGMD